MVRHLAANIPAIVPRPSLHPPPLGSPPLLTPSPCISPPPRQRNPIQSTQYHPPVVCVVPLSHQFRHGLWRVPVKHRGVPVALMVAHHILTLPALTRRQPAGAAQHSMRHSMGHSTAWGTAHGIGCGHLTQQRMTSQGRSSLGKSNRREDGQSPIINLIPSLKLRHRRL